MSTLNKISFSIIKANIGFSICLILLLGLCLGLVGTMGILPTSLSQTIDYFYKDYNMHQAYIYYDQLTFDSNSFNMADSNNIQFIDKQKVFETKISVDNKNFYGSVITYSDESKMKKTSDQSAKNNTDKPSCSISRYFANANNVRAGDLVWINTINGWNEFFVSDIIICPECLHCYRSNPMWCESGVIPFVYIHQDDLDQIVGMQGLHNVAYVYFDENTTKESRQTSLDNLIKSCDINVQNSCLFEDTPQYKVTNDIVSAIQVTLNYLPLVIIALSLFCVYLFLKQILIRSKNTLKLLDNLGYKRSEVLFIFINYLMIIFVIALLVGCILCFFVSTKFSDIFVDIYCLPYFKYTISAVTIIMNLFVIVACLFVSVIRNYFYVSKSLNGGKQKNKPMPIETAKSKKSQFKDVFLLIFYSRLSREKSRWAVTGLCIACSLVLTIIGVSIFFSYNSAEEYTYTDSWKYDATVNYKEINNTSFDVPAQKDSISINNFAENLKNIDNIETIQKLESCYADVEANKSTKTMTIKCLENACCESPIDKDRNKIFPVDGVIIEEYFAQKNNINIGDSITINNVAFTVENIARECVDQTLYIPENKMSCITNNPATAYHITLADPSKSEETYSQIQNLPGHLYTNVLDDQHKENKKFSSSVMIINYMLLFDSLLVALIVVISSVLLSLHLRIKEYTTLLLLGTNPINFVKLCFFEYAIIFLAAIIVGLPIGFMCADKLLFLMSSSANIYLFIHQPEVMIIGLCVALIYLLVAVFYTLLRIRKFDLVSVLNAKE